jgi:hypothetical protein
LRVPPEDRKADDLAGMSPELRQFITQVVIPALVTRLTQAAAADELEEQLPRAA